jgi:serine/threonine-protein kinase
LLDAAGDATTHQLDIGDRLGEGGMGEVRLAEQLAMRRQVAVKVQHEEVQSPTATLQLLREARVTGLLEHPNIVPIHALGRDTRGRPHIVMKRIEGEAWSMALLDRPPGESDDNLAFHLETLLQVIRAVGFAHSRGVLHLDIKPDNVMIGSFGEIYLVDWGVAVRMSDDVGHPDVPIAREIEHIVGTPHYMAPELVAAEGEHLSERTDVYLVGACLHQILTGEPPHEGDSLRAIFMHAFLSAPHDYGERWPRELTDITRRALQANPADRFPNVGELADALTAFLQHRHGRELAEQARERLRQLERSIDAIDEDIPSTETRRHIYDTFSACRFGYDLALREWGKNSRANRGLQRCLERMIEFELQHGSAKTAASYLAELPKENEHLAQQVSLGVRRDEAKGKAFERLRRDADVTHGDRLRGIVAMVVGVSWGLVHLYAGTLHRDPSFDLGLLHMTSIGAVFTAGAIAVTVIGRRVFFATAANTRIAVAFITVFVGYTAVGLLAAHIGLAAEWALAVFLICSSMVWTVLALSSDRRLLPLPAALASTILAILVLPTYAFELFGVASFVGPVAVALMWLRKET